MPSRANQEYDARDANGNRLGARRVAGPADPATRRAALAASDAAKPAPVQASTPAATNNPTQDLSAAGAANKIKDRKYRTMKAIDDQS
jgi:hypothetical protein